MTKIGIHNSTRMLDSGGGVHYLRSVIDGLSKASDCQIAVYFKDPMFEKNRSALPRTEWALIPSDRRLIQTITRGFSALLGCHIPLLRWDENIYGIKPDIIISQESLIGFYTKVPFISFIGDVMYKYFPTLDEYTLKKRFLRDLTTRRLIGKSVFTVVDSEQSKEDLVRFFKVDPDKVIPIPLCAPPHIYKYRNMSEDEANKFLDKYDLPSEFVLYPAQFWEHKNHLRLIEALYLLRKEKNETIPAVLVGSQSWDNYADVMNIITQYAMNDQVRCLGYVDDHEIVALYKKARALVYPSFADYTNIPVLEAMVLGVPIVCSNSFSMTEQVGKAGIFFDPMDIDDIADKIYRVWTDNDLTTQLIHEANRLAPELSVERFGERWTNLVDDALQQLGQ